MNCSVSAMLLHKNIHAKPVSKNIKVKKKPISKKKKPERKKKSRSKKKT